MTQHLPEREPVMRVDMPLLHRACAVANSMSSGELADLLGQVEHMAKLNPRRAAELVLMLAAAAGEQASTPDRVLEALDQTRAVDLSPIAREAHRIYEDFRKRGDLVILPRWAIVGYRVYCRHAKRRKRPRAAPQAPSCGGGC